jgi:uncharacterized membrane protein
VSRHDRDADRVEFVRMVTLTDGVVAIALTLLVLDLALPAQAGDVPLATALTDMAPRFFAFVISVPRRTTVKTHLANLLHKLELRDRVQAAIYAHEHGLVRRTR